MVYRLYVLFALLLVQASAFGFQGYGITKEENALLPQFCSNRKMFADIQNAGCPMLNHYCYGLGHMLRVYKNNNESRYWLTVALDEFQSVDQHWDATCPLGPEMHVKLGKALLNNAEFGGAPAGDAAENFIKAITLKPDYVPAYYALSDYYASLGNKKQALSVVEDGLRNVPDSKGLLRRFKELGGTTLPVPVAAAKHKQEESSAAKNAPSAAQETPMESTTMKPAVDGESPPQKAPAKQSTEPTIGTPSNPWCRFCPPQ